MQPGDKLAHYEILEAIGKGAMGEVYRARDSKLGREVAIKVLPREFARDEERLGRFEREARLLAQLNHSNVATLHGLEESDGQPFLVMELVEGETLAERIASGPIDIGEAIPLAIQIAEGLEAAHDKGIVHRDLKPANVKLTPEGRIKVLDFGLAKAFGNEGLAAEGSQSPTRLRQGFGGSSAETKAGVILGTAAYMSPEQARGQSIDKRTDIWAFGCVLFEMLTARAAFPGDSVADILAAIVKTEPDWESLPKETPRRIRELLRRCLRRDAARRLRDIGDARIEIEEALTEPFEDASLIEKRAVAGVPWLAASATIALVSIAVLVWNVTRSEPKRVTRSVIPLEPGVELASSRPAVALSRDGRYLAYMGHKEGSNRIYVRGLEELEARPVEGTEGSSVPFFSLDGRWLGYSVDDEWLMKVSLGGGAPVKVGQGGWQGGSWGPDGSIVFFRREEFGLSRVHETGGATEVLTAPRREKLEALHKFPQVLPGGEAVLFTLARGDILSFDDASIAVLDLESREYKVVLEGGTCARYSPTGHLVYARGFKLFAVPFDLGELEVRGSPVPVVEGVNMTTTGGKADFDVSDDGTLLYAPGQPPTEFPRVFWVDRQGHRELLLDEPRSFGDVRISPDGRYMAFVLGGANVSTWVYDTQRGTLGRLTFEFDNLQPAWSPDGARVAFTSNRSGTFNVYSQAADGSAEAERLTTSELIHAAPMFSPDGKSLLYQESHPETSRDLWLLMLDGSAAPEPFLRTRASERYAEFSPDGRWVVYESDETGRFEVYIRSFRGPSRKWQVSVDGGSDAQWGPAGREIFYRHENRMMVVEIANADGDELRLGQPRVLFEADAYGFYDVAPDGRFVMVERPPDRETPPTELVLVQNWGEELKRLVPTGN